MPSSERQPDRFTLDEVVELAKEVALEHGGHVPTVIAQGSAGTVVAQLADLPETGHERSRRMHAAGSTLARSGQVGELQQAFFIFEAWISMPEGDRPFEMLPSRDPNRKEVILISSLHLDDEQIDLLLFEMVRDDAEQLVALEPLPHPAQNNEGNIDSPLLNAFVDGFRVGRRTASN